MTESASELDQAVQSVKDGDSAAFEQIIELTERRLRAFLALQVPDRELVDEVAHQAYITAYEKLDEYASGTNFIGWLKRIAVNHLRNECRRRSHASTSQERLAVLIAPGPTPTESNETSDRVACLQRCLQKLPPDARRLLLLRYEECLEPAQIAEKVGKGASHVRTILTRLRQSLLECMEAQNAS
ncbi:MAG TPA: sigma-70 family RNA polymerase sigma factor [Planctomycetota bacterium]|nr:sigma-70 family RNA polymerase sigma factor [Planctomycetota bacterium]